MVEWDEAIDMLEQIEVDDLSEEEKGYIVKEVADKINYIFTDDEESTVEQRFNKVMEIPKESKKKVLLRPNQTHKPLLAHIPV